jgi:hypothetical protein
MLTGERVPNTHSEGLLILLVPTSNNQHPDWSNPRFEKSEEESLGVKSLIIRASRSTHERGTPNRNQPASNTFKWPSLGKHNRRVRPNNETDIKH